METDVDKEIEAIRVVLNALEPLDSVARKSVLDYVFKRLNIRYAESPSSPQAAASQQATLPPSTTTALPPLVTEQIHIKDFKEEKQPRTAIEMAALVAYYLENLAPESDRKDAVGTDDLDTYFKIAGFKLPAQQRFTLVNARNAGYFDSVGNGNYKLNAVGHNLVVHSMPRQGSEKSTPRRKKVKKSPKKTATGKKRSK